MTKTQQQRWQQWQQWIPEYTASGLSAREWCASYGVNPHRLWYWLRRFRTEEESGQRAACHQSSHVAATISKMAPRDLMGPAHFDRNPDRNVGGKRSKR
ncbi:MAG TPA: hypothetical protein GX510_04955 [Firmicutes bacterium]|nr:hypothetical protein [Candidatus Fermentithermobacillaceae bacterium]